MTLGGQLNLSVNLAIICISIHQTTELYGNGEIVLNSQPFKRYHLRNMSGVFNT